MQDVQIHLILSVTKMDEMTEKHNRIIMHMHAFISKKSENNIDLIWLLNSIYVANNLGITTIMVMNDKKVNKSQKARRYSC